MPGSLATPGREHRLVPEARAWLASNFWLLGTGIVVMGILIGGLAVVRERATEKDELRQAQVALAVAPGALGGLRGSPQAVRAGSPAAPSEFPVNRHLREELSRAITTSTATGRFPRRGRCMPKLPRSTARQHG
jgi:hypothetical protein